MPLSGTTNSVHGAAKNTPCASVQREVVPIVESALVSRWFLHSLPKVAALAFTVAITISPAAARTTKSTTAVKTGLDVFEQQHFAPLRGKRVGLITNHTGVDHTGRSVIDLLANAPGVTLAALFNPEHGLFGRADENVSSI